MSAEPVLFEAMITPHRSLSARAGRRIVIALLAAAGASASVFLLLGAWPVTGFCGGEIVLAATLLLLHARAARTSELVLLSARALRVVRTDPRGRRAVCELPTAWLNVRLEERNGTTPCLVVAHRERRVELGRVLGEDEKRDLAAALCGALDRVRNPIFVNAQLS